MGLGSPFRWDGIDDGVIFRRLVASDGLESNGYCFISGFDYCRRRWCCSQNGNISVNSSDLPHSTVVILGFSKLYHFNWPCSFNAPLLPNSFRWIKLHPIIWQAPINTLNWLVQCGGLLPSTGKCENTLINLIITSDFLTGKKQTAIQCPNIGPLCSLVILISVSPTVNAQTTGEFDWRTHVLYVLQTWISGQLFSFSSLTDYTITRTFHVLGIITLERPPASH